MRGGDWKTITKSTSLKRIRGFFTWCIKKDHLTTNPGTKLEGFILDDSEPCYLKLDQVVQFLEITKNHDPELLTPVALNLFCGIRPSEVARMTQDNISFADREIELKGRQTKTRNRRFVDISDNCLEWLKLGGQMPIGNLEHRWHALLVKAKAELGFEKWPHDCLRHSFCSYYLAAHENAAATALKVGRPKWIKKHGSSGGRVKVSINHPIYPTIMVTNEIRHIQAHGFRNRIMQKAVNSQTKNLKKRTEAAIAHAARKSKLKG